MTEATFLYHSLIVSEHRVIYRHPYMVKTQKGYIPYIILFYERAVVLLRILLCLPQPSAEVYALHETCQNTHFLPPSHSSLAL